MIRHGAVNLTEMLDHPVDWIEYEQWRDSYMGNAKEVNVPFVNLTEENIDDIQ